MPAGVNIRDVAARAGVSVGTVSHVLNHPELVADGTQSRVRQAMDDLGFVLNGSARQLRAGRSRSIGLVVLNVANPFFTDVARGAEDAANEAGYAIILCNSDESEAKERRYLQVLQEHRVQGVLITPVQSSTPLRGLRARGTSVVLVDRRAADREQCSVAVDDVYGGELATRHLLERGHRRIAFVNGPTRIRQCADRRRGVERAFKRTGLAGQASLVDISMDTVDVRAGEEAATTVVRSRPKVTAVFCNNDLMAIGLLRGLARAGVRVPDDVEVVGYDDIEFASLSSVPLSSVRQPRYELGFRAAELLIEEADDPGHHEHQRMTFKPELVIRESSGGHTL